MGYAGAGVGWVTKGYAGWGWLLRSVQCRGLIIHNNYNRERVVSHFKACSDSAPGRSVEAIVDRAVCDGKSLKGVDRVVVTKASQIFGKAVNEWSSVVE